MFDVKTIIAETLHSLDKLVVFLYYQKQNTITVVFVIIKLIIEFWLFNVFTCEYTDKYIIRCTTVRRTLSQYVYEVNCTLYSVHCTLYIVQCTPYTVHNINTQYTVHCTLRDIIYTPHHVNSISTP